MRKKVDNRLRVLIENGVALGHRSIFAIVGEKARDQVSRLSSPHLSYDECMRKSTTRFPRFSLLGGDSASHAHQGSGQSSTFGFVVLQKRTGLQHVSDSLHFSIGFRVAKSLKTIYKIYT